MWESRACVARLEVQFNGCTWRWTDCHNAVFNWPRRTHLLLTCHFLGFSCNTVSNLFRMAVIVGRIGLAVKSATSTALSPRVSCGPCSIFMDDEQLEARGR